MSSTLLIIVIFCFAIALIAVLTILSKRGAGGSGSSISDEVFKNLEKKDPLWKKETVLDAVKSTFDVLKRSYETKMSDVDTDVMTINIYRDLFSKMIPNMEKLSFIKSTGLTNMEVIRIEAHRTDSRNAFTVKLHIEGELPPGERPSIYWTFIRASNKWLLSEISDVPVEGGFFTQG
jgi:hypothetical protein